MPLQAKRWSTVTETAAREAAAPAPVFDPASDREPFTIDTPPPYPSGKWHIGAVAHYALIDMIARSRRKAGCNVHFPWGVDRNGINIELVVERAEGRSLGEFDRQEFIDLCRAAMDEQTADLETIARRIDMSCDFPNGYYTDSAAYRAITQRSFIELWRKGLIVEQLRPNSYDPSLGTTIAEAEIYYEERETSLYHLRWRTDGPDLVIATTRPELLCACQAVLVHPDDDRYLKLQGRQAYLPLYGRGVKVISHPYADPEYGSGAVMICSFGDTGDVQLFRELELEPVAAIGLDGCMTEAAGPYAGQLVREARQAIARDLEEAGLVVEVERLPQKFPTCERSKQPVEIILLKEWYVRQTHVTEELRKIADGIEFHPPQHKQILLDWLDTVTIDWPISRRRYYHTEIPLWYCCSCGHPQVPEPGPYYRPWRDPPPFDACEKCGHGNFEGETKVFDTWMDSSNSSNVVIGYGSDAERFARLFPCSLRPQGREIVRTWLYYTLLKSYLLHGKAAFRHVWITGLGMDQHGRKMSKSLGNIIAPEKALDQFGSEAFRFWIAGECTIGDDFRISMERIGGAKKFLEKLYNVARFVERFTQPDDPDELRPVDRWILAELAQLQRRCAAGYADFNFFVSANAIRNFVWNLFAPHYLELVKSSAYDDHPAACWTLHRVLDRVLHLLAPLTPCFVSYVGSGLYGRDFQHDAAPEPEPEAPKLVKLTPALVEFNSTVWKAKQEAGKSLAEPIAGYAVPEALAGFADVLTAMHRLE